MTESSRMQSVLTSGASQALDGALAGCAATIPMTAAMLAMHWQLTSGRMRPPPPYQVATEGAECFGLDDQMKFDDKLLWTVLSHFGYGTAAGGLYGLSVANAPLPASLKGTAFGGLVWAASYLGWLPAVGFRAAATRETRQRNVMMLAAHAVWGFALGTLYARRNPDRRQQDVGVSASSEPSQTEGGAAASVEATRRMTAQQST